MIRWKAFKTSHPGHSSPKTMTMQSTRAPRSVPLSPFYFLPTGICT